MTMKIAVQKFFSFMMALVMLLEAVPILALAESMQAEDSPIVIDEAVPRKVEITLPEKQHVLTAGEYSVSRIDDPSYYVSLIDEATRNAAPEDAPASANRQAVGCVAYSIALAKDAVLADLYEATVPVGVDMLTAADREQSPVFDSAKYELFSVHVDENGSQTVKRLDSFNVDQKNGWINSFAFSADAFSVVVLKYTADFHYEGRNYSEEGSMQMLLSDLIKELQIINGDGLLSVADVASVAFADEHPVTVTQVSGLICYNNVTGHDAGEKDFLLSSGEAFTTDEKLTITLTDGSVVQVGETPLYKAEYLLQPGQTEIGIAEQLYPLINLLNAADKLLYWNRNGYENYPSVVIYDSKDQMVFDREKGAAEGCGFDVKITEEDAVITGVDKIAAGDHITVYVFDSTTNVDEWYAFTVVQNENAASAAKPMIRAGETVVTEGVGFFTADEEVPEGTMLAVNADPDVTDAQRNALQAMMSGGPVRNDARNTYNIKGQKSAQTKSNDGLLTGQNTEKTSVESAPVFYEISLIGPDGEEIQTGAAVTLATDIHLPEASKGQKLTVSSVKVYHFTDDGAVEPPVDATFELDEDNTITSVSFTTPGFSLFAVVYTVDFVYIEKTGNISLNFENAKENGNELGQLIQKNAQGLEEIAVTDILDFIAQDADDQQLSGEVYTLSLSDTTALTDFDADFFSAAGVDIEGKGVEYGSGKITLIDSFDSAKITFAANHRTLELTLENYTKPIPPIAYAFHGVGVTASITDILSSAGIVSSYNNTIVSDEALVSIDGDTLTTLSFFDEVTLTLTLEDESTVTVLLGNPEFIPANTPVQSEAGSFVPGTDLAPGAELKAVEAEENRAVTEQAKAELGEDAQVLFYDIAIVDAEGNEIETGANVTLNLDIPLDIQDGEFAKVTGFVYHVTDKGIVPLDATFTLDGKGIASVTFSTDGFSLFGIAYTVELIKINYNGVINLNFSGYQPYPTEDVDAIFLYDTENCNIRVSVEKVLEVALSAGASGDGVASDESAVENFEIDLGKLSVVPGENEAIGVAYEDGFLIISTEGSITLTDEEKTLTINIDGITKLREEILEAEGVEIEVLEGNVPLGSEAQYTAHTEEETAALVEQYELGDGDVAGFSAADLKIVRNDEEVSAEGQFKVTLEKSSLIPEGMKLDKLFHIHDGEVDELDATETEDGLSFTMTGFSDIVASYTVDFEYNGYRFSMPGGGALLLSELFEALHLDGDATQIVDVTFTDPILLTVEPYGDEWRMYSHCAFATAETLTITMADGTVYEIAVTDDVSNSMNDAVAVVTINGSSTPPATVRSDEEYTIHLEFREVPGSVQFPTTGNQITYQIPEGFRPHENLDNVPILLTYTEDNISHTLDGCYYSVDTNGLLTVHLTEIAKQKLDISGDGIFKVDIVGFFTNPTNPINWGGGHEWNITVDDTPRLDSSKSGGYDSTTNKVKYYVNVASTGNNNGVTVTDTISGTALTLDNGSVIVKDKNGQTVDDVTVTYNGNTFSLTLPNMANKDRYTVEYTASVDLNGITDGGTIDQTENSVTINNGTPITHNLQHSISYNPFAKSAGTPIDTEDPDIKYIPWTITVNQAQMKNMQGVTFTDAIDSSSAAIMEYAEEYNGQRGIHVEWFNDDTLIGYHDIGWADAGVHNFATDKSWSTTIPTGGKYRYVYTYYTKVTVAAANGDTIVSNSVGDDEYHSASSQTTVPPGSGAISVEKDVVGTPTQEKMSWSVTMTVPASGLSKAVLTDYLPKKDYSGTKLQDTLLQNTLRVTGLDENEDYTLRLSKDRFVITFFKNKAKTEPGLNESSAQRTITVTFDTANDENWASLLRNDWHLNSVLFEGGNGYDTATAQQQVPATGFEKQAHSMGIVTNRYEHDAEVLLIEYKLDLYGVTEGDFTNGVLTITDNYDSRYLKLYNLITDEWGNATNELFGMDAYWAQVIQNGFRGGAHRQNKVNITDDKNGTLTFSLNRTDFPGPQVYDSNSGTWKEENTLLPHYQIIYYMVVKDGTTQAQLDEASIASPTRKITLDNTAHWGALSSKASVDYGIDVLDKSHINPIDANGAVVAADDTHYDSSTGMTGFQIVVNPTKLTLNGGSPLTLKDEFSDTLSVDYSSIKVYVNDSATPDNGSVVKYDYKGNVGTFQIPDATKVVIKYNAKVIGAPSSWVSYGNKVEMNGYKDGVNGQSRIAGTGEAGFNINSIRVYKYEAGDMTKPIEGVTFTMVDDSGEPVVYTNTSNKSGHVHNAGDPVTYTTGANGYAEIKPSEEDDGFSLQKGITYYLKETGTPSTYAVNNTIYRFTISDHPNYANYEYHSGDIMKIYNWPTTGRLEIRKSIVGGPENMTDEDKRQIKFTISGTYDEAKTKPVKVDEWGYTVKEADATESMAAFSRSITYADFEKRTENGTDYYSYLMEDLVDGYYTVTETNAALNGYQTVTTTTAVYSITKGSTTKTEQSSEVVGTNGAFTHVTDQVWREVDITNNYENPIGTELTIKKVNGDLPLFGAKFKLEKWDTTANAWAVYTDSSTDENGVFTITYDNRVSGVRLTGLVDGTYRVTEIKAPNNYEVTGDGIFGFTVSGNTVTWDDGTGTASVAYDSTNKLFTVNNEVKHNYLLTKVDGANVSLKLQGAKFGVYEHTPGNSAAQDRAYARTYGVEPLLVYTSDANGQFEILANDKNNGAAVYDDKTYTYNTATDTWTLDENGNTGKTYFIMETEAPLGYSIPNDPPLYYYYFGHMPLDVATTQAANLASGRRSATITNDLIELTVQKLWRDLDGNTLYQDDVDVIEFALFRTAKTVNAETGEVIDEGTPVQYPDSDTFYTIERDSSNNWPSLTISSLPQVGPRIGDEKVYYTYEVEETVPDGYQVTYTTSADGRTLSIINRPESIEIEAEKVWSENTPENKKLAGTVQFTLQRKPKNGVGVWENIRINPTVALTVNTLCEDGVWRYVANEASGDNYTVSNWKVTWNTLSKDYIYRVVENIATDANKFITEYSDGQNGVGEGKITVTNTYNATWIEAEKKWVNYTAGMNDTVTLHLEWKPVNDPEAVFTPCENTTKYLPNKAYINEQWEYVGDAWVARWDDLEAGYYYRVVEDSITNFITIYSSNNETGITSGRVSITNIKQSNESGKVGFEKIWMDADGNELPASDIPTDVTITGTLTRTIMKPDLTNGHTFKVERYNRDNDGHANLIQTQYYYIGNGGSIKLSGNSYNGDFYIIDNNAQSQVYPSQTAWENTWSNVSEDHTVAFYLVDTVRNQSAPELEPTITNELPYGTVDSTQTYSFTLPDNGSWVTYRTFTDEVGRKSIWTLTDVNETNASGYSVAYYNDDQGINTGVITMTNTETTSKKITVDKKWFGADGEITTWPTGVVLNVQLMKRAANGTVAAVEEPAFYTSLENTEHLTWSNSLQLFASTPRATWKYLDDLQTGESYEVHEVSVEYGGTTYPVTNGKVTVNGVTYQVFNGTVTNKKATVTNAALTDVNVTKTWDVNEDGSGNVSFEKPDGAVVASGYLSGNTVTVPKAALVIGVQLRRYGKDENGDPVANTDFNLSNPNEAKCGEVKLLYSAATPTANGRYSGIFTDGANWAGEWQNLPTASVAADGTVTTYSYSVEEVLVTVPASYMHNGSNGQVNILNQFQRTLDTTTTPGTTAITNKLVPNYYLDVTKEWRDNNGIVGGDPIEFQLLRQTGNTPGNIAATIIIGDGNNYINDDTGFRSESNEWKTETGFFVDDTITLVFDTPSWFNGYQLVGATEENHLFIQEANNTQTITFTVTSPKVYIKTFDGGIDDKTAFAFSLVHRSPSNNGSVLMRADNGYEVDDTGANTFTLSSSNNWTMRFKNLPLTGVENGNTVNYTYSVQEVAPTGTDSQGNSFTVSYSLASYDPAPAAPGGNPQSGAITITNTYEEVTVTPTALNILKQKEGASGNEATQGIRFTLRDASNLTVASGSTAADGTLTLAIPKTALGAMTGNKTFTLVENNTPEGYVSDSPWTVTATGTKSENTYNWAITSVVGASGTAVTQNTGYYTIVNPKGRGALKLTKNVTVGGSAPNGSTLADGTYTFSIAGPDPETAVVKYVQITVTGGVAVSHKLADTNTETAWRNAEPVDNGTAIVSNLVQGDYVITEITPDNGAVLASASGGKSVNSTTKAVTVHVTTGDTTPINASAHATFTNNRPLGSLTVTKAIQTNDGTGITVNPMPSFGITVKVTLDGTVYYVQDLNGTLGTSEPATSLSVTAGRNLVISNLPYGNYTVAETEPNTVEVTGYNFVEATVENGSVTTATGVVGATSTNAALTNKYTPKNGKLRLYKMTDPTTSTESFTFTITFSGTNLDKVQDKTFTAEGKVNSIAVDASGVATVSLAHGEYVLIKDLPADVTYTITEEHINGWTNTVKTNETGTVVADQTAEASFTNVYTEISGAPRVQKTLSGRDWVSGDTFTFTMAADGTDTTTAVTNGVVVMPATRTVDATSATAVSFQNITFKEAGTYYFKITETAGSITGITYSQKEVIAQAVVTKDTSTGAMAVTWTYKDVKDDEGQDVTDDDYAATVKTFTNTYDTSTIAQIKGTKAVTNGTALSGYVFALTDNAGVAVPGISNVTSDAEGKFEFAAITYTMDQVKTYGTKDDATSIYTATYTYKVKEVVPDPAVTDAETALGYAIRSNIKYVLAPVNVTVTVVYDESDGTMTATVSLAQAALLFTNEQLGSLQVTKTVKLNGNNDSTHGDTALTFHVGLFNDANETTAISGSVKFSTVASGYATGTVTYDGLTIGQQYYVFETDASGNKLSVGDKTQGYFVTDNGDQSDAITLDPVVKVDVENEKRTGDLELTKCVGSAPASDASKQFEFTITLTAPTGETLEGSYSVEKTPATGSATTETKSLTWAVEEQTLTNQKGYFTVTLGKDETVTVKDLPAGTGYMITETDYSADGYTSNVTSGSLTGTITGGTTVKESVEVTNSFSSGDLIVTKTVAGNAGSENKEFAFSVTLTKTGISGNNGSWKKGTTGTVDSADATVISFTDGNATVTFNLKHNEVVKFVNLPVGTEFTVTETVADLEGYETTVEKNGEVEADKIVNGSITATGSTTAAFTNTKNTTSVEATKAWTQNSASIKWPEDVASVEFKLYKTVNGEKSEVTTADVTGITNPVTVTRTTTDLKATWSDLPVKYWLSAVEADIENGVEAVTAGWYTATYTVEETKVTLIDGTELTDTTAAHNTVVTEDVTNPNRFTITNSIPSTSIKAKKNWANNATPPANTTVELTINATVDSGSGETTPTGVTISPLSVTLDGIADTGETNYETIPWEYEWANLPKYDTAGKLITYTVAETAYTIGEVAQAVATADATATEGYQFSFTNTLPSTNIKIVKVEQGTETTLSGAKFQLKTSDGTNVGEEITIPAYGEYTFQNLPDGQYKLVETQAPAGYNMMSDEIIFTITGGTVTYDSSIDTVTYTPKRAAVAADPDNGVEAQEAVETDTFTIGNTPGTELPSTGGPGILPYTLTGLTLLLGAALWLLLRRRREQNT